MVEISRIVNKSLIKIASDHNTCALLGFSNAFTADCLKYLTGGFRLFYEH